MLRSNYPAAFPCIEADQQNCSIDRELPVPSTSMRVPPTEPGFPDSFLVMIAIVGLRKQLLRFAASSVISLPASPLVMWAWIRWTLATSAPRVLRSAS